MTRSTAHRIIDPRVAALCLSELKLRLHVERRVKREKAVKEQPQLFVRPD